MPPAAAAGHRSQLGGDNNQAPRAFAFEIASKVGAEFCQHNSAPEPLAETEAELKKQAAAEHPGLCGLYHALVIAAKAQDVEAQVLLPATSFTTKSDDIYVFIAFVPHAHEKLQLFFMQAGSQVIFMPASHACHINTRSHSCS